MKIFHVGNGELHQYFGHKRRLTTIITLLSVALHCRVKLYYIAMKCTTIQCNEIQRTAEHLTKN